MDESRVRQTLQFMVSDGLVACVGRLVLLVLYVVGLCSIAWPDSEIIVPLMGSWMAIVVGLVTDFRGGLAALFQPDDALWKRPWDEGRRQVLLVTGARCYAFFLACQLTFINLFAHPAWILPLPVAAMALQKLVDRLARRQRPSTADADEGLHVGETPVRTANPGLHGEQCV